MSRVEPTPVMHATRLHGVPATVAEKPQRESRWGRRVAWLLAMVAIGAGLGFAIIWMMKFIDGPSQTTASTTQLSSLQAAASPTPSVMMLSGLNFEMQYPSVFDQVATVKNDSQSLEQYNISSKKQYARLIAVGVRVLPGGKLEDDSSFRLRQISPADYVSGNVTLKGEPAAVFTKKDHTEKTLFWAHGGKLLTVAITSSDPKDDVVAYMDVVMQAVRWRQ